MHDMKLDVVALGELLIDFACLETDGDVLSYFSFRQDWLCRKGDPSKMVLMKVCGDSMEPDIRQGNFT